VRFTEALRVGQWLLAGQLHHDVAIHVVRGAELVEDGVSRRGVRIAQRSEPVQPLGHFIEHERPVVLALAG
jgi:hypothetical protein